MKKLIFLSLTLVLFVVSSCKKDYIPGEYEKVVILYMAANNNLSDFAEDNIAALEIGFIPSYSDKNILLVFSHLSGKTPVLKRYYKDIMGQIQKPIIALYPDFNSADSKTLESVLDYSYSRYKSKSYALILWSHSTGWLPKGYYSNNPFAAFPINDPFQNLVKSFGLDSDNEMEITNLAESLNFKLSYIIFDCCFSGGIETAYQLKDKCDYIIASPTEILSTGFPYQYIMNKLFATNVDLDGVCQDFYDYYLNEMNLPSATIALYNTSKLEQLAEITSTIFDYGRESIKELDMNSIQPYFRFDRHWFYDMGDFVSKIATPEDLSQFQAALNEVVISKYNTPNFLSIPINKFSGISTYIPNPREEVLETFYKDFEWNKATSMIE